MNNAQLILQNSLNVEYYTPAYIVEAARRVMGRIFLDPASCDIANRTVKASMIYTKENNGLDVPWFGNVWLNLQGEKCKCNCHSASARNAETYTRYHLIISMSMGDTSAQSVSNALERHLEKEQLAQGVDKKNRSTEGSSARNALSKNDEDTLTPSPLQGTKFARSAANQNPLRLNTFREMTNLPMALVIGANSVPPIMQGKKQEECDQQKRGNSSVEQRKGATEHQAGARNTTDNAVMLTTQDGGSIQLMLPLNGQSIFGQNVSAHGLTSALTVEAMECLHKITLSPCRHPLHPEQCPGTWFPPASLATILSKTKILSSGAAIKPPLTISYDISTCCNQCVNCMEVRFPSTVFMNHPFGKEEKPCKAPCKKEVCKKRGHCVTEYQAGNVDWVNKFVTEYEMGNMTQGCCITFAATSEGWAAPLFCYPICFLSPRTNYYGPDGKPVNGVTKGSMVAYLGRSVGRFVDEFRTLGRVMLPA